MNPNQSSFATAIDKIVADCNDRLLWVPYSKDKLTKPAARVLIEQWSSFTRHSRQCWAHVVGNCPIVEVRKFIVTENLYEEEAQEGHSHFEILARMGMALGLARDRRGQAAADDHCCHACLGNADEKPNVV